MNVNNVDHYYNKLTNINRGFRQKTITMIYGAIVIYLYLNFMINIILIKIYPKIATEFIHLWINKLNKSQISLQKTS